MVLIQFILTQPEPKSQSDEIIDGVQGISFIFYIRRCKILCKVGLYVPSKLYFVIQLQSDFFDNVIY